jgi:hypothetical protein
MKAQRNNQEGQALVQVALALIALLAFLALAVDVGNVYSRRRQMQNAADAGALAGAWEICFGDPAMAEATAMDYAMNRNEAMTATVTFPSEWVVNVQTGETSDLFFAGIIGWPTMDVGAVAEAACGAARNLCGIWPITFHEERWNTIPCIEDNPDAQFYLWNDDTLEEEDAATLDDGTTLDLCELCDCDTAFGAPDGNSYLIGPGHRGWVNFPRPEAPYPDDEGCTNNCGANQSVCIIDSDGYLGRIDVPPEGICLPGQPGVTESVRHAVERNLNAEVNILIWDGECAPEDPVTGTCSGTPYHIVSTGCVVALDTPTVDLFRYPEYQDVNVTTPPGSPLAGGKSNQCMQNVKTILAERRCDCESSCGSTTGGPPGPGEVRAVSLTQ